MTKPKSVILLFFALIIVPVANCFNIQKELAVMHFGVRERVLIRAVARESTIVMDLGHEHQYIYGGVLALCIQLGRKNETSR